MIEMTVRTVDHSPRSGQPLALLLPRDRAIGRPLTLPIGSNEACSLSHELEHHATPRTRAYALLMQTIQTIGGYLAAIIVEPDGAGAPAARVRVGLPRGWAEETVDLAVALGLSVHTALPVLISEQLARSPTGSAAADRSGAAADTATASDEDQTGPAVPGPFLHALDD